MLILLQIGSKSCKSYIIKSFVLVFVEPHILFPSTNATSTPAALSPSVLTTPSKIEPMKAFDSRFTERSKTTPGAPNLTSVIPTAVER